MTEQAFGTMVAQYEKLIYTVCYQMVHDHQLAEDLTQETFFSAWLHADSCPEAARRPWLCRIAANKAKDHLKSAYSRRVRISEDDAFVVPDNTAGLELQCELRDDAHTALQQINALSEPYRTVSVLYFEQELPVETIAALVGRMPKTVHTQLYRAKKKLRQELAAAC